MQDLMWLHRLNVHETGPSTSVATVDQLDFWKSSLHYTQQNTKLASPTAFVFLLFPFISNPSGIVFNLLHLLLEYYVTINP